MWSWSHTQEAYENCYDNLCNQDRKWLKTVYGEWKVFESDDNDTKDTQYWNEKVYNKARKDFEMLDDDDVINYIWDKMNEQANCTNGGYMAHACPYECGCHEVSFSKGNI